MPSPTPATHAAPNPLLPLLDDWEISLDARRRSKATIVSYRRCALNMIAFFADNGMPLTAPDITRRHVEAFIAHLLNNTSSGANAAKHYRSLQQFFKWLDESEGETPGGNPMAKMSPPKVIDKPPAVITDAEMKKLLAACKGNTFENRRDTALISFFYDTGCRVGEVVGMQMDDYDAMYKAVTVTGKGNRKRGIGTSAPVIEALRRYLRSRTAHPMAEQSKAFWLGRKGPLTVSGIAQLLERRCKAAGIDRIHPHQFRHTFAHNWSVNGGNETDLMNAAGWRSRDMLARYGRSAAGERAQEATRNLSGLDKLNAR